MWRRDQVKTSRSAARAPAGVGPAVAVEHAEAHEARPRCALLREVRGGARRAGGRPGSPPPRARPARVAAEAARVQPSRMSRSRGPSTYSTVGGGTARILPREHARSPRRAAVCGKRSKPRTRLEAQPLLREHGEVARQRGRRARDVDDACGAGGGRERPPPARRRGPCAAGPPRSRRARSRARLGAGEEALERRALDADVRAPLASRLRRRSRTAGGLDSTASTSAKRSASPKREEARPRAELERARCRGPRPRAPRRAARRAAARCPGRRRPARHAMRAGPAAIASCASPWSSPPGPHARTRPSSPAPARSRRRAAGAPRRARASAASSSGTSTGQAAAGSSACERSRRKPTTPRATPMRARPR